MEHVLRQCLIALRLAERRVARFAGATHTALLDNQYFATITSIGIKVLGYAHPPEPRGQLVI